VHLAGQFQAQAGSAIDGHAQAGAALAARAQVGDAGAFNPVESMWAQTAHDHAVLGGVARARGITACTTAFVTAAFMTAVEHCVQATCGVGMA
jgi:hypothetical protein